MWIGGPPGPCVGFESRRSRQSPLGGLFWSLFVRRWDDVRIGYSRYKRYVGMMSYSQTLHGTAIYAYIGVVLGVNVGIYGIHGVSGTF